VGYFSKRFAYFFFAFDFLVLFDFLFPTIFGQEFMKSIEIKWIKHYFVFKKKFSGRIY